MRQTCRDCARKHLAQAVVLLSEAAQGYPEHYWLAMGHMAEASDELVSEHPQLAEKVREVRKLIEAAGPNGFVQPAQGVMNLIHQVTKASGKGDPAPVVAPAAAPVTAAPASPGVRATVTMPPGVPQPKVLVLKAGKDGKLADGRTVADAVREHHLSITGKPPAPAITAAPSQVPTTAPTGGCSDCDKNKRWREALEHADMKGRKRRLVILTTLANFDPAYSLSTCTLEQAHAAEMVGLRVNVIMMDHAVEPPEGLPEAITIERVFPTVPWHEDKPSEHDAKKIADKLWHLLSAYAPCDVISHDLLFQAWFVSAASAIHSIGDRLKGVRWFHLAHSSVNGRPADAKVASLRASLPEGHNLLTLNLTDRALFQAYYQAPADRAFTLGNSRDLRPFHRMPEDAVRVVSLTQMHMADVAQVYPLSATRLDTKGLHHVINLFAAIKSLGKQVRLVVACGHANGDEGKQRIRDAKEFAKQAGLAEDLFFTSDLLPETAGSGISSDSVRALFQASNVFAFPSVSEASPLALMEAALSGCYLVLNSSLQCLYEHIPGPAALWVPWGSLREHGSPIDPLLLAGKVIHALVSNPANLAKRHIMQSRSIDAYGEALLELLEGPPAP